MAQSKPLADCSVRMPSAPWLPGLIAFVALACGLYTIGYLREEERLGLIDGRLLHRYYVLTPIFIGTMMAVPLVNNLGLLWVVMESTTLESVLLVRFYNQKSSLEAAWKYIIIGSAGMSLALFGTVLTYFSAVQVIGEHAENGFNWSVLMEVADKCQPAAMRLGFVMILVGYGTKAGLVPMHTWKPDAYAEAPVPSAALLGAAFINCAIYGIMRFYALASKCLGHDYPGDLLVLFGVASILVAAPVCVDPEKFPAAAGILQHRPCRYHGCGHRFWRQARRFGGAAAHVLSRHNQAADVFLRGQCSATRRNPLF